MTRTKQRLRPAVAATVVALLAAGSAGVGTSARAATPEAGARPAHTPAKTPTDPVPAAIKQAKATRQPVAIASLTDEYSTTSANPDGTLTRSTSTNPKRVRQGGKWVPIDTTLVRRKDGSYAPKAALSQLSVSGGGGTGLLTMKDGSRTLAFSWAAALPAPVVHGDTATYAEVYPGVDLQIIADATGYSSMLVVKTAQAAANPALAKLDLGVRTSGLRLAETRDGGAEAVDSRTGQQVFQTGTAAMWDSSPATGERAQPPATTPQETRAAAERLGGHRSKLTVRLAPGRQTLALDQKLLTAKTTRFPVYVDPYWSGSPSQVKWARISSNGWDVYNSTSKTGATSARIGYDDWPGGAAERARTYYQMNTAGIRGAQIFDATLYVVERWAASCYNTDAVIYGTAAPSGWGSSTLYWGHEPGKATGVLSTASSKELNCGTSNVSVTPADLKFDVRSFITAIAGHSKSTATFLVEAKDMNDKYGWKQLNYGGGATLSVRYSYKPVLFNGTGTPTTSPSVVDQGRNVTTTHTPTISAKGVNPKANGYQENVRIQYQVFNSAGSRIKLGYSGYSLYGSSWTVPSLTDGTYTWKATVQNASGLWAGVYTATQTMVVDTVAPHAPTVRSSQFPPDMEGGAYTDKGLFQLGNDKTNNVTGYLFSLDHDLASVVYASTKGTPWTSTTTLAAQTIYYAKADNGNGTGTVVVNGSAGVSFAPITSGARTLYVKAVDQAGSTSPQTAYTFLAGRWTPTIAYGSKLVSGWTATNNDQTTTTVPAATKTGNGHIQAQAATSSVYFGDGYQAMLVGGPQIPGAADPTMTVSFNVPETGAWELGANLTEGHTYGIFNLTFDQGKSTAKTLLTGFDGYTSAETTTEYKSFGALTDAGGVPMTLTQGVHTLTWKVTGWNDLADGSSVGVDLIRLSPLPTCWINDTSKCRNNAAISRLTTDGTSPAITKADADGGGTSLEAADLEAAGWTEGATITVNGAAVKLPTAFGHGADDNILANGQVVRVPTSGVVNRGNAVVFVGLATQGPVKTLSGSITYAATSCGMKSQQFTIGSLSDWAYTPAAEAVLTLPRRNNAAATRSAVPTSFFAVTVPLLCPGAVVDSIKLPVQTDVVQSGVPATHIFGLGIRPIAVTGSAHWVGSWSAAQDTAVLKPDFSTSSVATLSNQTVRIPARLSIGTKGGTQQVRVHLANSLGTAPVTFDAASVALQDSTAGGATAAAVPIPLTFGGSASTTVPAGGDVVSDAVTLTVPDRTTVLVSVQVHGNRATVPGHRDAPSGYYTTASDGLDHTTEQSAANFHLSVVQGVPYLSGIDVTTPASDPDGALVLFGDQTINSDRATYAGAQFSDQLTDALAEDDRSGGIVPFGVLNQGTSNTGSGFTLPAGDSNRASSAGVLVDREILSQPNVRTVLISAGTTDLLACTDTPNACADGVTNRLEGLASQARNFKSDGASDPAAELPTATGGLKVYVATLPPFTASHTANQEAARELVNGRILANNGLLGYADGAINFASAVSAGGDEVSDTTDPAYTATIGTGTYPNDQYYARLAEEYLNASDAADWIAAPEAGTNPGDIPVAEWKFNDGTGTTAQDTGSGTGASNSPTPHNATLTNVGWVQGRLHDGFAGTYNGTSAYASTDYKPNVAKSYSVSAWVRLTDKSANRTVFARGSSSGGGSGPLTIRYNKAQDRWQAEMPSAPGSTTTYSAMSENPAQTGVWTHLAVVYDAEVQSLTLYVNGSSVSVDQIAPYNDVDGATWIGRGPSEWFAGDITETAVWARPLGSDEVDIQETALPVMDWELDFNSSLSVADDSWGNHPGTLVGGATDTGAGHADGDPDAVHLNGTDAWVSTTPVARTDQSFSIAAWVNLTSKSAVYTAASQEGAHVGRFMLQYRNSCDCWRFTTTRSDADEAVTDYSASPAGVTLNKWTHLAGVYDASAGTITLYVNGVAMPSAPVPAGWKADGPFTAGRTLWDGIKTDKFAGDLDAVQVYQGVISQNLITQLATP